MNMSGSAWNSRKTGFKQGSQFDNSALTLSSMAGQISTLGSGMLGYELFEQPSSHSD